MSGDIFPPNTKFSWCSENFLSYSEPEIHRISKFVKSQVFVSKEEKKIYNRICAIQGFKKNNQGKIFFYFHFLFIYLFIYIYFFSLCDLSLLSRSDGSWYEKFLFIFFNFFLILLNKENQSTGICQFCKEEFCFLCSSPVHINFDCQNVLFLPYSFSY